MRKFLLAACTLHSCVHLCCIMRVESANAMRKISAFCGLRLYLKSALDSVLCPSRACLHCFLRQSTQHPAIIECVAGLRGFLRSEQTRARVSYCALASSLWIACACMAQLISLFCNYISTVCSVSTRALSASFVLELQFLFPAAERRWIRAACKNACAGC